MRTSAGRILCVFGVAALLVPRDHGLRTDFFGKSQNSSLLKSRRESRHPVDSWAAESSEQLPKSAAGWPRQRRLQRATNHIATLRLSVDGGGKPCVFRAFVAGRSPQGWGVLRPQMATRRVSVTRRLRTQLRSETVRGLLRERTGDSMSLCRNKDPRQITVESRITCFLQYVLE